MTYILHKDKPWTFNLLCTKKVFIFLTLSEKECFGIIKRIFPGSILEQRELNPKIFDLIIYMFLAKKYESVYH